MATPSQSAKPSRHARRQVPAAQAGAALAAAAHGLAHAPQWAALARVSTSQPFIGLMSQSAKPGSQVSPQRPAAQAGDDPGALGHCIPQPPQCAAVARVSTSQPLPIVPSQSAKPALQALPQRPSAQRAAALGAAAQWASVTHATQRWLATSQRAAPGLAAQAPSAPQPASQRLTGVQCSPAPHEPRLVAVHATHAPEAVSHTRRPNSSAPQSVLSRHRPDPSGGRRAGARRGRRG